LVDCLYGFGRLLEHKIKRR